MAHFVSFICFNSPEPLSHGLSSTIFKYLLLQTRLAYQNQISYGASVGLGNESCLRDLGHLAKMAATPIYGKNPSKIFFSIVKGPIILCLV